MLTKRDYWTITSIILIIVLLFQLINVAGNGEGPDGTSREAQSVTQELTQELTNELAAGDEDR